MLILLTLCLPAKIYAQDIHVEAVTSSHKVALGSSLNLTLKVTGTNHVDPVDLPTINGFDVRYLGPATQISIINGHSSSSIAHNYSLFSLKVGQFEIPAIHVNIDGKTYTTEPIPVEVVDSSEALGSSSAEQASPNDATQLQDKIFVVLKVPKKEVYLGELVPVKILFFVTGLSIGDLQYPKIEGIGYKKDDLKEPEQYEQIVKGVPYKIVEFNTTVYPTRTGQITLGPVKMQCNILVKDSSQDHSPFDNSLFNDDFFGNFFNQYERRPIALQSEPVDLNVLELPQEGRPQDFSDAVGHFDFDVNASPSEVKVGDPVTLKMTIQGKGNLAAIQFPRLKEDDQIKLYEPTIKEQGDVKTFEQVVIPNSDQVQEIPALGLTYFDVDAKQYRTITKGPFPIIVKQLPPEESLKVVGLDKTISSPRVPEGTPEVLGQDIVYIKESPGSFVLRSRVFYQKLGYLLIIILGFIVWLAFNIIYFQTRRLETDTVYAKRLHAPREAKKGLKHAFNLIASEKTREFYDALFKTWQQYLAHKWHWPLGNVTSTAIQELLISKKVDAKIIENVQKIFEECEAVRFAPVHIEKTRMSDSLKRVEEVIDYLEKHVK